MPLSQVSNAFVDRNANRLEDVVNKDEQGVSPCFNNSTMQKPGIVGIILNPREPDKVEGAMDVRLEANPNSGPGSNAHATKSCCEKFKNFFKQLWSECKKFLIDGTNWIEKKLKYSELTGIKRFFAGLGTVLGGVAAVLVGLALCTVYVGVIAVAAVIAGGLSVLALFCLMSGSDKGAGAAALLFSLALGLGASILASPGLFVVGGLTAVGLGIKSMAVGAQGAEKISNPQSVAGATS